MASHASEGDSADLMNQDDTVSCLASLATRNRNFAWVAALTASRGYRADGGSTGGKEGISRDNERSSAPALLVAYGWIQVGNDDTPACRP